MCDHWNLHAQRWHLVAAPLRPSASDVAAVTAVAATWQQEHGREPRVLVLGVTPELVSAFEQVTAVDIEPAMIEALFVARPGHQAVLADWRSMPIADASIDIVVGDGSLNVISYPDDYYTVASELRRVLAPGGLVVLRLFATPEVPESMQDVAASLQEGFIGSLHALKWRIAMALPTEGGLVRSSAILDAFNLLVPDRAALAACTGWDRAVIDNIDIYKDSQGVRAYPPVSAVRRVFAEFTEHDLITKSYELGERCPTIVFST